MTDSYDYLIIGGGIAGVTAAETIRAEDPHATIAILSDEPHVLYSRVLLPAYLKHKITREQLFLRKPDDFTRRRIDLLLTETALDIDSERRQVRLENGNTIAFQKLLLATGGKPIPWGEAEYQPILYRLQTLEDADRLWNALPAIRRPLVVGASFMSLEFLEIFILNNLQPVLLARDEHFFAQLIERRGGALLADNFARFGIISFFRDGLDRIARENDGTFLVATKNGERIACDAIGVGVGLDRHLELLTGSGIEVGERGIRANEYLETNQEGIYAAGDAAEFYDRTVGGYRTIGNWNNAFMQGKRVGLNMVGIREPFQNVSAYAITNLGFQITALGDCNSTNRDTLVRSNPDKQAYQRLFFADGALVGAVLINWFSDKMHLAKLIQKKVPVGAYRAQLNDPGFDVRKIEV